MTNSTVTPSTIHTPHRRYRVGDAVIRHEAVHTVLATDLGGVLIESVSRDRTQEYIPAHQMDALLKPAP